MRSSKSVWSSPLLGRTAHADVFELAPSPRVVVLLFGGSCDEDEYVRRAATVIPVFDTLLSDPANTTCPVVFVHVTAPFDVPFARFDREPVTRRLWAEHVTTEVLAPWPELPFITCGYSGGAALALNGVHADSRCVGGAGIAATLLPRDFVQPRHWPDPLQLYVGDGDPVCHQPEASAAVERLSRTGQAECVRVPASTHRLSEYATPACLGDILRRTHSAIGE